MPTQKSPIRLRQAGRKFSYFAGCVTVLLSAVASTNAALQEGASAGWTSTAVSYGTAIVLIVVLVALFGYKRRTTRKKLEEQKSLRSQGRSQLTQRRNLASIKSAPAETNVRAERPKPLIEGAQLWAKPVTPAPSAYGAYRIDQEVSKLAVSKPHYTDVIASRVVEDRRAVEASLIKALESPESTENGLERVRQTLEEYGFVARQSATMLMGRDAWERSSAARVLGQICAPSSLPFLIEALHDVDPVVRNQAVTSLGLLKSPSAIGALIDIARRHPEIPPSLLSETLSACSVESFGFFDSPSLGSAPESDTLATEPGKFGRPGAFELPSGDDDVELTEELAQLESSDKRERTVLAQSLALHPVQRSVSALTSMVMNDPDPSVRAAAVASLGSIDHESVLAPVLIALADEARTVQAAAARALTSLHFRRSDGYVSVTESAAPEVLRDVARACIKTGIVAQAVDRLASEDRRQSFEAFSLFSLLVRANEMQPIVDAIKNHQDEEVRLSAVKVLSLDDQPSTGPMLRDIVSHEGLPESVRTAVLEVLNKLDHDQPVLDLSTSDNMPVTMHNSP